MNISEESIPGRRNKHKDLVGDYRNLTLTLKEIGSHWREPSEEGNDRI